MEARCDPIATADRLLTTGGDVSATPALDHDTGRAFVHVERAESESGDPCTSLADECEAELTGLGRDRRSACYRGTDCEGGANGDDDLVGCYHQGGSGEFSALFNGTAGNASGLAANTAPTLPIRMVSPLREAKCRSRNQAALSLSMAIKVTDTPRPTSSRPAEARARFGANPKRSDPMPATTPPTVTVLPVLAITARLLSTSTKMTRTEMVSVTPVTMTQYCASVQRACLRVTARFREPWTLPSSRALGSRSSQAPTMRALQ